MTETAFDGLTVQPVAYFARCIWGGCEDPVQFLQLTSRAPIPLCGSHGLAEVASEVGRPVAYGQPLGHISTSDPEPTA